MRMTRFHAPTLRDAPKEAELPSHRLLTRAGFIRQLAAGIYDFLPLAMRSLVKVQTIIRQEMNRAGALEVLLPAVQPASLWEQSSRWDKYGPELLRFVDRKGNDYCFGPTHEEVIVDLVRRDVRSYRQLPLNLYQIQGKFRDEIRPRAGLMRGREFVMKDAYSFDVDPAAAEESYRIMYDAYARTFARCGLDVRPVQADTGNIGGSMSHEFQALATTGEDAIVSCAACDYTANVELAGIGGAPAASTPSPAASPHALVDTPGQRTIDDVTAFLGVGAERLIKTLIVDVDGEPWAALVRGDRELNEIKLRKALGADEVFLAGDEVVVKLTGAPVGYAGPVGLGIPVVADPEVMALVSGVCGANKADAHFTGVIPGRDFNATKVVDIRVAVDGDACPSCGEPLQAFRGIEVGHVFYLGTKYSEPMECTFLDANGKPQPMVMGCYGMGVTRILAAVVEQHYDDKGIIWPVSIAPFELAIVPLGKPGDATFDKAEELYAEALELGLDVVVDDRKERPGVKMADSELIGHPFVVVVGKRGLVDGMAEFKTRASGETVNVPFSDVIAQAAQVVAEARR